MMPIPRVLSLIVVAVLWLGHITSTRAQETYAGNTARLIVGFAPGGGNDILARLLADKLSVRYGASFIVDNRPGANGVLAISAVKRSTPNGLTILVGPSSGMTFNPILLKEVPYDPVNDFAPIAMIGSFPLLVVVKADSPLTSLADLVAAARSKPDTLNYSSAATSFQLATETFLQRAAVRVQNVPYRGSAPAATAVLSGDVIVNFGDISALLPLVQGGQLRALAVTTSKRLKSLPDVPTIDESGYPGFEMVFWSALFLPAATPETIRAGLEADVQKIVSLPDVLDRMAQLGIEPSFMPGAALRARIETDIDVFRKVAATAGIKPE